MKRRRKVNVIEANGRPDARLKISRLSEVRANVVTKLACNMTTTKQDSAQTSSSISQSCYCKLAQVTQITLKTAHLIAVFALLIVQLPIDSGRAAAAAAAASSSSSQTQLDEYQLIGQARSQVRLPCLIGKQKLCGEPYFIAWYKLNATSHQWTRIEARSRDEPEVVLDERSSSGSGAGEQQVPANLPLSERIRFDGWSREMSAPLVNCLSPAPTVEPTAAPNSSGVGGGNQTTSLLLVGRHQRAKSAASLAAYGQLFDCAQLSISSLELADEGQYKCEITFADSLDPERCPASTLTHLTVIARPNEPEILLNGRSVQRLEPRQLGVFKEGAQIRLECQSSGGKPAPRIEWLNLTSIELAPGERRHELQLLRSQWPIKRTHLAASGEQQVPLSSSSIGFTLSRFDLQSRFVCLVMAASLQQQQQSGNSGELPASLQDASQLAAQLDRLPMLSGAAQLGPNSMIKWIKLDIMARPTSVSMQVLDLASNSLVSPNQMPLADSSNLAQLQSQQQQPPFYSLRPNQMYAIQCLVENSRPRSQVAWFNRTSPIELETVQLDSSDFILPQTSSTTSSKHLKKTPPAHRISSFTRYIEHSGTYRTVATLLLTTNFYDNFEELFCRVSNEAFQFDELLQVAPILSVRIFVNYPLSVWLEAASSKLDEQIRWPSQAASAGAGDTKAAGQLTGELGQRLQLRCQVAANPLLQNSILQIEWLKDGRRLQAPQATPSMKPMTGSQTSGAPRVQIEKANHLHMPMTSNSISGPTELGRQNMLRNGVFGEPAPLAGSSRLLSSSLLTISALQKQDAGQYSCQFKLIPAPSTASGLPAASSTALQQQQQQQQQIKIVSGQASQPVQLRVIEAKLPVLRASSSNGLSFLLEQPIKKEHSEPTAPRVLFLLADEHDRSLQLKCDFNHQLQQPPPPPNELAAQHKVVWLLDGLFFSSSSSSNVLNVTQDAELKLRLLDNRGGRLSCALQTLEPTAQDSPSQFSSDSIRHYQSMNAIELRFRRAPKLIRARRRDLMPAARSFSDLELSTQPGAKLKLVCLATCEPTCSIDWLLNGRALAQLDEYGEFIAQRDPTVLKPNEPVNRFVRRTSRLGLEGTSFNLGRIDTQLHLPANRSMIGGPAWVRHTSNLPLADLEAISRSEQLKTRGHVIMSRSQLERATSQLLNELEESIGGDQPATPRANVFSRLELSYNSLGQLLGNADETELLVECRLNSLLSEHEFSHASVEPNVWFPTSADNNADPDESPPRLSEILSLADEQLFNATPFNLSASIELDANSQSDHTFSSRISLDKAPKRVFISLEPGAQPVGELQLNEKQLKQLLSEDELDKTTAGPILNCSIGSRTPPSGTQFKWTFTSSSQHVTDLLIESQPELNLKQLIDLRRRQLEEHSPNGSQQLELMANLFGNYTCWASNSRGTVSSSFALSYQGRPVCKLNLLDHQHQQQQQQQSGAGPIISFGCKVYSAPRLLETVWLRNEQPIASNKSEQTHQQADGETPFQPIVNWLRSASSSPNDQSRPEVIVSPLSLVELPLVSVYSSQLQYPFNLAAEALKCVGRNSFGFSDPCELSRSEIQSLAMISGQLNGTQLSNKLDLFSANPDSISSLNQLAASKQLEAIQSTKSTSGGQLRAPLLARNWLAAHLDWLLLAGCSLVFIWLVFIFGAPLVRRRLLLTPDSSSSSAGYGSAAKMSRKFRFDRSAGGKQAGWRFQTNASSRASSTNEFGLFANNKFATGTSGGLQNCYAAYGVGVPGLVNTSDSNGDSSEHTDMVQSCSQSSHYEDFLKHQIQQQQHQRAIYLNQNQLHESTTLSRRPLMKSSQSTTSTGSHYNDAPVVPSAATFRQPIHASRIYAGQQQQAATSARAGTHRSSQQQVPIIGTHGSSRIQFNELHPRQSTERNFQGAGQQQTFDGTLGRPRRQQVNGQDHIYDDVMYNQMIL